MRVCYKSLSIFEGRFIEDSFIWCARLRVGLKAGSMSGARPLSVRRTAIRFYTAFDSSARVQ